MHLVEIEINASSTAFFTSHPDTLTWNNQVYAPVPMRIGEEEIASDMSLPRLYVDVSNYAGQAYQFAKDNDLSLNDVTIRLVNLSLTSSGEDVRVKLQIIGSAFSNDAGRFSLGFGFSFDVDGPRRTFNTRDFPSMPTGDFARYVIVK